MVDRRVLYIELCRGAVSGLAVCAAPENLSQILQHSQQAGFGGAKRRRNQHLPFARGARER